jgi:chemosensory pili system protein ChpA (sensor histidine kinase/response regulator)
MAANPKDFDLGPLTWVKTEIDHSLSQAREHLDKLAAAGADRAPVKYILTHLHQATGALAMVGLAAATRFNEELEKLVAHLEGESAGALPATVAAAKKGIAALSAYLDTLLAGETDFPMRLLAPYLDLNHARGANDANEGDLFFPTSRGAAARDRGREARRRGARQGARSCSARPTSRACSRC